MDGKGNTAQQRVEAGSGQHQGLPVAGYQPQTGDKVAVVNAAKELEERCMRHLDAMAADMEAKHDPRMIALARTGLQEAWMWANRAVFQPARVSLPEDASEG